MLILRLDHTTDDSVDFMSRGRLDVLDGGRNAPLCVERIVLLQEIIHNRTTPVIVLSVVRSRYWYTLLPKVLLPVLLNS